MSHKCHLILSRPAGLYQLTKPGLTETQLLRKLKALSDETGELFSLETVLSSGKIFKKIKNLREKKISKYDVRRVDHDQDIIEQKVEITIPEKII